MALTSWAFGLGITLGLYLYHLFFIASVLLTKQILYNEYSDASSYTSQQLTVRNELDSTIEFVILIPSVIFDKLVELWNYLMDHKGVVIAGVLIVPICLLVVEYPNYWIPVIDEMYNGVYLGLIYPLKIILNIARLLYDVTIGVWDFISRVYVGGYQAYQTTEISTLTTILRDYVSTKGIDAFHALERVIVSIFQTFANIVIACFNNRPANVIGAISLERDYVNFTADLQVIGSVASLAIPIAQQLCERILDVDLVIFAIAFERIFVDYQGSVQRTPVYDAIRDLIDGVFGLVKVVYIFPVQSIPSWFGKNVDATSVALPGSKTFRIWTRTQFTEMVFPLMRGVQGVGLYLDYATHFFTRCFSCYLANLLHPGNQQPCMQNDNALQNLIFLYPYQGGFFYGFASWMMSWYTPILLSLNAIGNVKVLQQPVTDVVRMTQHDDILASFPLQLRYDKHASTDVYPTFVLWSAVVYGGANTLTIFNRLKSLANVTQTSGQLALDVGLFVVDGFMSDIYGPILEACPFLGAGMYQYAPNQAFTSDLCYCVNSDPTKALLFNALQRPYTLWKPNTGGASRFPFIRPIIPSNEMVKNGTAIQTYNYQCTFSNDMFNDTAMEDALNDYGFSSVATTMPPCPYSRDIGQLPPFRFATRTLKDSNITACLCYPKHDYANNNTFCTCGTADCRCTSPYYDSSDKTATYMYCNFDPSIYLTENELSLPSNDLVTYCRSDMIGGESDSIPNNGGIDPALGPYCVCPTTFAYPLTPQTPAADGSPRYYCPSISRRQFNEYTTLTSLTNVNVTRVPLATQQQETIVLPDIGGNDPNYQTSTVRNSNSYCYQYQIVGMSDSINVGGLKHKTKGLYEWFELYHRTTNCMSISVVAGTTSTDSSTYNPNNYAFYGMGCSYTSSNANNCAYRLILVNVPDTRNPTQEISDPSSTNILKTYLYKNNYQIVVDQYSGPLFQVTYTVDTLIWDPLMPGSFPLQMNANAPNCPKNYLVCNYKVWDTDSKQFQISCCPVNTKYTFSSNAQVLIVADGKQIPRYTTKYDYYEKEGFDDDEPYFYKARKPGSKHQVQTGTTLDFENLKKYTLCLPNYYISSIDFDTYGTCKITCQELIPSPSNTQAGIVTAGFGYNCVPSAYKVCNLDNPLKFQRSLANFYMYDTNLFQAYQGPTQLAFGQQKYMCRIQSYYMQLTNQKTPSFQYRILNGNQKQLIVIPSDVWEGCYCPYMSIRMYVSYDTRLTAISPEPIATATNLTSFFSQSYLSNLSTTNPQSFSDFYTVDGNHNPLNAQISISSCNTDASCPYDAPFFNPYGDDATVRYLYDPQGSDPGVPMPVTFCRCSNGWDPIMPIAIFNNITTSLPFTPSRMYLCLSSKSSVHDDRINIQRNRFNGAVSMINFKKTYNASITPQAGWVSTITLDCYDKTMFEISALGFIFPICYRGTTGAYIPKRYHTLFNEKQNFSSGYEYFSNVPASSVYSNPDGNLTFNPSLSATSQFQFSTRAKIDAIKMATIVGQFHATTYSNAYVILSGKTSLSSGYFHVKLKCIFANVFSQRMIKRAFPVTTFSAYNTPDNVDGAYDELYRTDSFLRVQGNCTNTFVDTFHNKAILYCIGAGSNALTRIDLSPAMTYVELYKPPTYTQLTQTMLPLGTSAAEYGNRLYSCMPTNQLVAEHYLVPTTYVMGSMRCDSAPSITTTDMKVDVITSWFTPVGAPTTIIYVGVQKVQGAVSSLASTDYTYKGSFTLASPAGGIIRNDNVATWQLAWSSKVVVAALFDTSASPAFGVIYNVKLTSNTTLYLFDVDTLATGSSTAFTCSIAVDKYLADPSRTTVVSMFVDGSDNVNLFFSSGEYLGIQISNPRGSGVQCRVNGTLSLGFSIQAAYMVQDNKDLTDGYIAVVDTSNIVRVWKPTVAPQPPVPDEVFPGASSIAPISTQYSPSSSPTRRKTLGFKGFDSHLVSGSDGYEVPLGGKLFSSSPIVSNGLGTEENTIRVMNVQIGNITNIWTRLASTSLAYTDYVMTPAIDSTDALFEYYLNSYVSFGYIVKHGVRCVFRIGDFATFLFSELVRAFFSGIDNGGRAYSIRVDYVLDKLSLVFMDARIAIEHIPSIVYETIGYIVGNEGGSTTGLDNYICLLTEYPNFMYINSVKAYTLSHDTCSAKPSPFGKPFLCDLTDDMSCKTLYLPYHNFNVNPMCAGLDFVGNFAKMAATVIEAATSYITNGVLNAIECITTLTQEKTTNDVCKVSRMITYPTQLMSMLQCSTTELSVRFGSFIASLSDAVAYLFYAITDFQNLEGVSAPHLGPVVCSSITGVLKPETCSEIGSGPVLSPGVLNNNTFFAVTNPVCMYNILTEECLSACSTYTTNSSCRTNTFLLPVLNVTNSYCSWTGTDETHGACYDQMDVLMADIAVAEAMQQAQFINNQQFPIQAGVQTFVASYFNVWYYLARGLDMAASELFDTILNGGISRSDAQDMSDSSTAPPAFDGNGPAPSGPRIGHQVTQSHTDKIVQSVSNVADNIVHIIFSIVFRALSNYVLWVRDQCLGLLMCMRGFVITFAGNAHYLAQSNLVNEYSALEKYVLGLVGLLENLYNSFTTAMEKLVEDMVNLVLRILIAIGGGAAFSTQGLLDLANAVWVIVKDYIEFIVTLLKNIFVQSGIGKIFVNVANIGCGAIDDVIDVVSDVEGILCQVIKFKINFGFFSFGFSSIFGVPGFCNSLITHDPLSRTCAGLAETSTQTYRTYEASVCYGSAAKSMCSECVARNQNDCLFTSSYSGTVENLVSPGDFAMACPCSFCAPVDGDIGASFYCDQITGLCVCGKPVKMLELSDFINQVPSAPGAVIDTPVARFAQQNGLDIGSLPMKQRLVIDETIIDYTCPIVQMWQLFPKLTEFQREHIGDTVNQRQMWIQWMQKRHKQALHLGDYTRKLPTDPLKAQLYTCNDFCSNAESNQFNDFVVLFSPTISSTGQSMVPSTMLACAINLYQGIFTEMLQFGANYGNVTKSIDSAPTYAGSRHRRNVLATDPMVSSLQSTINDWQPVWTSGHANGTQCTTTNECMAFDAVCAPPNATFGQISLCAGCPYRDKSGDIIRRCEPTTLTCVCGYGSVGPPITETPTAEQATGDTLNEWSKYAPFLQSGEWTGNSWCDSLVNAYLDAILNDPASLRPVEVVEVKRCLTLRTYGLLARTALQIPTLRLDIFYNLASFATTVSDAAIATLTLFTIPLNSTELEAWTFFSNAKIDPVLGYRLYQGAWTVISSVRSSFSFSGVVSSIANALDVASPGSNIGDPLRSLSNTTTTIINDALKDQTMSVSEQLYRTFTSIKTLAVSIGKASPTASSPTQAGMRRLLSAREERHSRMRRSADESHTVDDVDVGRHILSYYTGDYNNAAINNDYTTTLQNGLLGATMLGQGEGLRKAGDKVYRELTAIVGNCTLANVVIENTINATEQMAFYYSKTFVSVDICNVKNSFKAYDRTYDGFERRKKCGDARFANETRLSLTSSIINYFTTLDLRAFFTTPTLDTYDYYDYTSTLYAKINGSTQLKALSPKDAALASQFLQPFGGSVLDHPLFPKNLTLYTNKTGFTYDVARFFGWFAIDFFDYATRLIIFITTPSTPSDNESEFLRYIRRLFQCDYQHAMKCHAKGSAGFLQGLIVVVVAIIVWFWLVQQYAPSWLNTPMMAVSALFTPLLSFFAFLFIAYGESPICLIKANAAMTFFVMLPYCLMDDFYDLLDIFIFPRNIPWGDRLVHRSNVTGHIIDATNATLCTTDYRFHDGFANIAYLIQRLAGNGYIDRYSWVKYIAVYPLYDTLTAFQSVELQPNDVYEDCFWITSVNIFPALFLIWMVLFVQLLIVYVVWAFLSAFNIFLRDIKNSSVFFGMYNDELKEAYAEKMTQ